MNMIQFKESMQRVLAFTMAPSTPDQVKHLDDYLRSLYESVARWDAFTFDQATKELVKSMTAGRKPGYKDLEAIYARIMSSKPKPEFRCVPCGTTGWVTVWLMETATGRTERFVRPCPECRSQHPFKDARTREGWVELEGDQKFQPDASTQAFIEDRFGKKFPSPQQAMDWITVEWREQRLTTQRLVDVIASKVKREKTQAEAIKERNRQVKEFAASTVAVVDPKPVESDTADVAFPDVPPNVRDIPLSERERLDMEAQAEDIPF